MWYLLVSFIATVLYKNVEGLKTQSTIWPKYKAFYPISNQRVEFSVMTERNVWVVLSSQANPGNPKYEIVIGRNENQNLIYKNRDIPLSQVEEEYLCSCDYEGFWIQFHETLSESNKKVLRIEVGQYNETQPFLKVEDAKYTSSSLSFFSVASTGIPGETAEWHLYGVDEKYDAVPVHINTYHIVTKLQTSERPTYEKFYKFPDDYLEFKVRARNGVWIALTGPDNTDNKIEINFLMNGTQHFVIYKNGKEVLKDENINVTKSELNGFWLKYNMNYEHHPPVSVLYFGSENKAGAAIEWVHFSDPLVVGKFALATTSSHGVWTITSYLDIYE